MVVIQFIADNFSILASVSAVLISAASLLWSRSRHILAPKRDVLRRLLGTRHLLTNAMVSYRDPGEPFIALNEVAIVYCSDKKVCSALKQYFATKSTKNLVLLIRKMAKAARANLNSFDDDFVETPFAPNVSKCKAESQNRSST